MSNEGQAVRHSNDPSQVGVVTGETRETGGRCYQKVRLASGEAKWILHLALEPVTAAPDALADLAQANFSKRSALSQTLTHIRLTGRLADLIYSMESTNTEFHAYQFKPVVKILNAASKGLLIADEVGLGKTIEAGLVWTELVARYDMQRLLVVCPKSLQEKWRMELSHKFGVRAQAVDAADLLRTLQENERTGEDFALVATLSGIRAPRNWNDPDEPARGARADLARFLDDRSASEPLFDLVVFDEAHHLRNPDTAQHRTARQIVDLADYKLMLSATPINLRSEDLRSILRLVEPDLFDREWIFSELQTENVPIVAAREAALRRDATYEDLKEAIAWITPGRFLKTEGRLGVLSNVLAGKSGPIPAQAKAELAARLEEMSMLGGIVNRTRRRDVNDFKVQRRPDCRLWSMSEGEREFYEAASNAIVDYALSADMNERFLLSNSQRMLASCLPAAYSRWSGAIADLGIDDPDVVKGTATPGPLTSMLSSVCGDRDVLADLKANDSKLRILLKALTDTWTSHPDEKVIVFSSFRGTIDYLETCLREAGTPCLKMHGSVKRDRNDILREFQDTNGRMVLLTSEVGGEGLDLQFCRILVNYDLPWNPMKVEQRIGRIDRIGQKSPSVEVLSLICEGTIEERIYRRLYERLNLIVQTLGGYEPILGDIVRELENRLLDPTLSPQEAEEELDRQASAAEARRLQEEALEKEAAGLIAHGDMILHRIQRTHEQQRWIQPFELYEYVSGALRTAFPGTQLDRAPTEYEAYDFAFTAAGHLAFREFLEERSKRFKTDLRRQEKIRIVFGKPPENMRGVRLEAVTTSHPLVRFAAKIRGDAGRGLAVRPAVAGVLPRPEPLAHLPLGRYGLVVQKWSTGGATPQDRLVYAALHLDAGLVVSSEDAEALAMSAARDMTQAVVSATDAANAAQAISATLIQKHLDSEFQVFFETEEAAHSDKRETLIAVFQQQLNAHRDRVERLNDERLREGGNRAKIVPAERAKLAKYVALMDHKIAQARAASDFDCSDPETHAAAIVELV